MTVYQLDATAATVHGAFSPERTPILRIQSGDIVEAPTLDAGWGLEAPRLDGGQRRTLDQPEDPAQRGHALVGPLWIEGAQPGHTLVVHIEQLIPGSYGFTYAGGFPHRVYENLGLIEGGEELLLWSLDAETMTGQDQHGHRLKLNPFLGVMGMPPPEPGFHATAPPRIWGGNIDCKNLVAGTKLFLPVPVEGGLFSFGDGHAAQGHGEVSVTAIECPMEYVRLKLELRDDMPLTTPRAWTPHAWITFGFHAELEQATYMALDAMLDFMMAHLQLPTRKQALALASAIVDLEITQIANPTMGVQALLRHDALLA